MSALEKVKILVVGDSGVGKSSAVYLICHNSPISNPSWTIGCSVEVKLYEFKEGTPQQKSYFVELWDIGGSNNHKNTRGVFYNSYHGIILVHDLTNKKSQENLRKWMGEILHHDNPSKKMTDYSFDQESFADTPVPVLVVGTKLDLLQKGFTPGRVGNNDTFAEECGADHILLDCHNPKSIAPGSSNAVKLSRFFDKAIEKRHYPLNQGTLTTFLERRRPAAGVGKLSHVD